MTSGDIGEVTVDGKDIEVVTKFVFVGALITKDGLCEKEVRRKIAMGKAAMGGLTSIWKIEAFELLCWRKTNIWIIENIKPEWTLESRVPKAALSYFGHVVRAGGMEDAREN